MDTLKKMDKKYLLVIGGIFGVIFLIIIVVALMRGCSGPSNDFEGTEDKMISAAEDYFSNKDNGFPKEFGSKEVTVKELAKAGYMDDLTEYLEDTSCEGKVTVYNHGGQYLYVPDLNCSEYKTKHLADVIIKDNLIDVPEDEYQSGLYLVDNTYIFKGKEPNNYVSFGTLTWRIIDIDENGIIRLIKSEPEERDIYWDNKFNSEANKAYGINDYEHSYLVEKLNDAYASYKDESKLHIAPHSACIGKRGSNDISVDRNFDCSETLDNQYLSIISSSDFGMASLDTNCTKVTSGACVNYNYLYSLVTSTWTTTPMNDNTYDVVYIGGGIAARMSARNSNSYNLVLAIRGDEEYISGDGTVENPYVIGNSKK